jgi:hypothetical protein
MASQTQARLSRIDILMDRDDLEIVCDKISTRFPDLSMIIGSRANNRVTLSVRGVNMPLEAVERLVNGYFPITLKTSTEEIPVVLIGLH